MVHRSLFPLAAAAALIAAPAVAEVTTLDDRGFVSRNEVEVPIPPSKTWQLLLAPAWWNPSHSYSGASTNLTIEAKAGGCFCELIPAAGEQAAGSVEHMRVIHAAPYSTLRMAGALGPPQAEAVSAVLTVTITPTAAGSRIVWEYVVGGFMRPAVGQIAPLVDQVMSEQLSRLAQAART